MNPILCEISAPPSISTDDIGHIAKSCAIDLKLPYPLTIVTRAGKQIHITLSVDLASAISGEGIWKLAATTDTRLIYRPIEKSTQTGLLKYCDCCKSPGRIEFRDALNQEFLQLCAPEDIEIEDWSHLLQDLTNAPISKLHVNPEFPFPKVPRNTQALPFHPDIFGTILSLLCDQKVEIEATLVTPQTVHKQSFPLKASEFGEHTLLVRATNASLELDLESIQELHLSFRADRAPQIYASGPDRIQLICIEPSSNPVDIAALNGLLNELVPELM